MDSYEVIVAEFLADCEGRNLSVNTVRMYRDSLKTFGRFLEGQGLRRVPEITTAVLRAYAARSLEEVSAGATHARLRPVKTLLRWCVEEEVLDHDPSKRLKLPKIPEVPLQVMKPATFKKLLSAAKASRKPLRNVALLTVLYDTGLRASEVCGLDLGDVMPGGFLLVRSAKGGKVRSVPLGREGVKAIRLYVTRERPETELPGLFLVGEDARMTHRTLGKVLERLCADAGVETFSPHSFRRGFVVQFVRGGGDVFSAQRIMGHTTLAMSTRYARMDADDLRAVHRRASPVARSKD